MKTEDLPKDSLLSRVYARLQVRFDEHVKEAKEKPYNRGYFWKWISTTEMATDCNISVRQMRKLLNTLEQYGLVHSKRESNNIKWSANEILGFKQHQYDDYFCPDFSSLPPKENVGSNCYLCDAGMCGDVCKGDQYEYELDNHQ